MTAPASQRAAILANLQAWLEQVKPTVIEMHHHRGLWKELHDVIIERVPESPGTFLSHYTKLYVDSQAMAIRRLADRSAGARSLANLVFAIARNPAVIDAVTFSTIGVQDADAKDHWWRREGLRQYEEHFGDGSGVLDVRRVESDLASFLADCETVQAFATKTLAHLDRHGPAQLPTFGELDRVIHRVGELFKRYYLLLNCASWWKLEPVIQEDWRATFRVALFDPPPALDGPRRRHST